MIEKLLIKNVALIDRAEIDFSAGLNVLSGETGAGKSVILDSINFVLGAKADKTMIRHGESECSVQAVFSLEPGSAAAAELAELDVENDGEIIVSRRFSESGKSTIKINGTPVTAAMLRRVTSCLVDVHGQSEHFYLLKESNQLAVLDRAVGERAYACKEKVRALLSEKKELEAGIAELGGDAGERERRLDLLRFQIEEIQAAAPGENEEETLLQKREKWNHMEKISEAVRAAGACLDEERGAIEQLRSAARSLSSVSKFDAAYGALSERLEALYAEAEDVGESVSDLAGELYYDEAEAAAIEDRLDLFRMLKRKYGGSMEQVSAYLERASAEYDSLTHCDEEIAKKEARLSEVNEALYAACCALTACRKETASDLESRIVAELQTLHIAHPQFVIDFSKYTKADLGSATAEGMDRICFLFSANAGEPLKPLDKIISGGEMSRFMLAVKTQLSENEISSYLFDEIDAGISGVTASVVAEKFAKIAQTTQIIAVSHLAQIAAMADTALLIEKSEQDEKTHTDVKRLEGEARVLELVRLIGGTAASASARAHAEELLQNAAAYKRNLGTK